VEADEELLVVKLDDVRQSGSAAGGAEPEAALHAALAAALPEGIEVLAVTLTAAGASFQPTSAEYVFPVRMAAETGLTARLQDTIARVMGSEHCPVERAAAEGGPARTIDVRPFLCSIRLEDGALIVQHRTGTTGSVRVDEILRLFELRTADLDGQVRRRNVHWELAGATRPES
jgi:hypothetical protein